MSQLHIRQIKTALTTMFDGLVDIADYQGKPSREKQSAFLTRSLAALALTYLGNASPVEAAQSIVDGYQDNGLDAVFYGSSERVLYIVQSKWHDSGQKTIDRGELQKFLKGFSDLINARWTRFNAKLATRSAAIEAALNDANTRIHLVLVYTGQQALSAEAVQDIRDVIDDLNDPVEIVTYQVLRQSEVYGAVSKGIDAAPIDLEAMLYEWGQVRTPYKSVYGQVSASDLAQWYSQHQSRLFAPNIRMFLGATDVNETILGTLDSDPQDFWYYNNGVTALCREVVKKPIGGNTRDTGYFECKDVSIVNGAQTVGAIAQAYARHPDKVALARVMFRIISLENCPPEFDKSVTRFNNTQNRIDRRDFVSLDLNQERIRGELQLEGVTYAYKAGDAIGSAKAGFDLVEATVSRACLQRESSFAVQAKREIGKLWEDITKAPYTILFNGGVDGPALWRCVQVLRVVEDELSKQKSGVEGRPRLLAVHGNRYVAHLVFQCLSPDSLDASRDFNSAVEREIRDITRQVYDNTKRLVDRHYPDAYLSSLFKNATKCEFLKQRFRRPRRSD